MTHGNVHMINNDSDLKNLITTNAGKLVLIDFTATWCGPCQRVAPIFVQMSEKHTNVVFVKIDVDECPDITENYGVNCMPTFVFLKNGKQVKKIEGADVNGIERGIQENA